MEDFNKFSQDITGFPPYKYQSKVAKHLLNGKNVILSVPTGAGKTWASILPFLYAKEKINADFPQKMIYSLPLRALCNSISQDVNKALKETEFSGLASIQTGEFSEDKYFEKDIVFSTIDQTLSNFLCFPLALSKRQANVNAGAVIGSYLIFDEFHLLDRSLSMSTTMGMLRALKDLSRFCIMTATLSDEFMGKIKNVLPDVEIVTLEGFEDDANKIGSLKIPDNRKSKKEIEVVSGVIRAEKIIETHEKKSIVICNRVETAQRVFLELEKWAQKNKTKLICLHSRFFDSDRKSYESQLKILFGKNSDKNESAILIATQVIEAGIDISCENMHTEIAPINALLQRAGRCARYEGEYGKIYVYDILSIEEKAQIDTANFENLTKEEKAEIRKLTNRYLPYDDVLCKVTHEKLKLRKNKLLNEDVTTRLVNEILGAEEADIWNTMSPKFNADAIKESWEVCKKSSYRNTIRDIQSLDAVIISEKKFAEQHPYSLQSISVFKWSLIKVIKEVLETVDTDQDWVVGVLEESSFLGLESDEGEETLEFRAINDIDTVKDTFETLYLNSKHFNYDKLIGFNRERGSQYSPYKIGKTKENLVYTYKKDTFYQHTRALLEAFECDFFSSTSFVFDKAEKIIGKKVNLKKLVQLILILHDYGKLDVNWQAWMQDYQKELSLIPNSVYTYEKGVPLGHSGFNNDADKEFFNEELDKIAEKKIFKKRGKRPPHSGVGAKVIIDVLEDWLEDDNLWEMLKMPVSLAIRRHHGVEGSSYPKFKISDHNYEVMQRLLDEYGFGNFVLEKNCRMEGSLDIDIETGETDQYLLYLFFVRILRLCDQKATENYENYLINQYV